MITDIYDPAYYRQARPEPPSWPATDPAPEVRSTDVRPEDAPPVPSAVLGLRRLAEGSGWAVRVGYSRSRERAVRVGTYKLTEVFGVWAGSHPASGWRFLAQYARTVGSTTGWSWRSVAIWKPRHGPVAPGLGRRFLDASVTDLKGFIEVRGSVHPGWFKGIHARVVEQQEKARLAARNRPKQTKEGSS